MTFEVWMAFVLASAIVLVSPGPTVLLTVSYALERGKTSAWTTVSGAALGDFTAMTLSLLGAGALLTASATLFNALKLAGAAYLIWLGVQLLRGEVKTPDPRATAVASATRRWHMFRNAFAVTALHPGGFVFFVSFVPQFVDPAKPAFIQFLILEATFLLIGVVNLALWALLAGAIRVRTRDAVLRAVNRSGGAVLIALGCFTAVVGTRQQ